MLSTVGRVVSQRAGTALLRPRAATRAAILVGSSGRWFHASTILSSSSLPYHIVVGLPALSPTMESGSLAEWYVAEGDGVSAGDAIAKIETDKASIDFEAQDDYFIAKLLCTPGSNAADLAVGTPIMITVEDQNDVAAFQDYVLELQEAPPAAAAATKAEPAAPPASPPAAATPPPPPTTAAPPPPPPPPAVPTAPLTEMGDGQSVTIAFARPNTATPAPLTKSMNKQQDEYIKLYGTTGQKTVTIDE